MSGYLYALLLATLPSVGNFAGGVLAESVRPSPQTLSRALHVAAGIVIAVVGIELMPQALEVLSPVWATLVFVAGAGCFILLNAAIDYVRTRFSAQAGDAAPWTIYAGVCVDLFSDGLMIGTGTTVSGSLGLLLALGQVPADIPEGFATISTLRRVGVRRLPRILLSCAFAIPLFVGVTLGYWAVQGQPETVKLGILAFTAGILLSVAIEEIMPEAHREPDTRGSAIYLVGGFALFAFLTSTLG